MQFFYSINIEQNVTKLHRLRGLISWVKPSFPSIGWHKLWPNLGSKQTLPCWRGHIIRASVTLLKKITLPGSERPVTTAHSKNQMYHNLSYVAFLLWSLLDLLLQCGRNGWWVEKYEYTCYLTEEGSWFNISWMIKTEFPDFLYYLRRLVLRPSVKLLPAARDRVRGPEGGLGLAPLGGHDIGRHPAGTLPAPQAQSFFTEVLYAQTGSLPASLLTYCCVSRMGEDLLECSAGSCPVKK